MDEIIEFPDDFTLVRKEENYLLLFAEKPAWVCLTKSEYDVYLDLLTKKTYSKQALGLMLKNGCENEKSLVKKLFDSEFVKNPIENKAPEKYGYYGVHLILTHDCNIKCKHCYMSAGENVSDEITYEELIVFLDQLMEVVGKPLDVVLSGGEPLSLSWLPELIGFLSRKKCLVDVYTNGLLLTEDFLNSYSGIINNIQIGMEGVSEKSYEFIRGEGNFSKLDASLSLLKKHNINASLSFIIMPHNFEEFKEGFKKFVEKYFYPNLSFNLDSKIDWMGRAEKELDPSVRVFHDENFNEIAKVSDDIFNWFVEKYKKTRGRSFHSGHKFLNCGIGFGVALESNGDIFPCYWATNKFKNIRGLSKIELADLVLRFERMNKEVSVENMEECSDCDLKYICAGGCKAQNYECNNCYTVANCNESVKNLYYNRLIYNL